MEQVPDEGDFFFTSKRVKITLHRPSGILYPSTKPPALLPGGFNISDESVIIHKIHFSLAAKVVFAQSSCENCRGNITRQFFIFASYKHQCRHLVVV